MDLLNSKASTEELLKFNMEKTNKTDMDMQMKCIDILRNQLLQVATVLLETIKQNVTTKLVSETEKQ